MSLHSSIDYFFIPVLKTSNLPELYRDVVTASVDVEATRPTKTI